MQVNMQLNVYKYPFLLTKWGEFSIKEQQKDDVNFESRDYNYMDHKNA